MPFDDETMAHLLERARTVGDNVSRGACLLAQGSSDLQDALFGQIKRVLKDRGIAKYRQLSAEQCSAIEAELRQGTSNPTPSTELSRILSAAADYMEGKPYGPSLRKSGMCIVAAVEHQAPIHQKRFDALKVIWDEVIPCQTVTDWEWNGNPYGPNGARALLRRLAERMPESNRHLPPDTLAVRAIGVDLGDMRN